MSEIDILYVPNLNVPQVNDRYVNKNKLIFVENIKK